MLFIWDDTKWNYIRDDSVYDTKTFVIVRKLFGQLLIKNPNVNSIKCIRKEFKRFRRDIEEIKLLTNASSSPSNILEFYIQFKDTQRAFKVFNAFKNNRKSNVIKLLPADSWKQPINCIEDPVNDEKCSILKLIDDCLLYLFDFFYLPDLIELAQVCKRFRGLLEEKFKKVDAYTVYTIDWPVNTLRKALEFIGPHLTTLHIKYQNYCIEPSNLLQEDFEKRITQKIVKNVGEHLTVLTIFYNPLKRIPNEILNLLAPILQNIQTLTWNAQSTCDTILKLCSLCPQLETLTLKNRQLTCEHRAESYNLCWPNLKSLEILQWFEELNADCVLNFNEFLKSNPQLERLKLKNVTRKTLETMAEYSTNLKYLELIQNVNSANLIDTNILSTDFMNLEMIVIREKITPPSEHVRDRIRAFKMLPKLKLIVMISNCMKPILSYNRPKYFPFAHDAADISMENNQLNLSIGPNMTKIDLGSADCSFVNIINTGDDDEITFEDIRESNLMDTFLMAKTYFPQTKKMEIFKNSDCCQTIYFSQTN